MRHITRPRLTTLLLAAALTCVVGCDQGTKLAVISHLTTDSGASVSAGSASTFGRSLERFLFQRHPQPLAPKTVVDGLWHLRYVENPGASWNMFRNLPDQIRVPFLLLLAVAGMIFVAIYFRHTPLEKSWQRLGLVLVGGGALGNFLDRLRLGYVIDWIHWHWFDRFDWPVFNIADAAITTGVALILLQALLDRRRVAPTS